MESVNRLELVKQGFAAFRVGDGDTIRAFLDPGLVVERFDPDHAVYHGPEGLFESAVEWSSDFVDWTFEVTDVFEVGERVIARSSQGATSRTSGAPVQQDFWFVLTFSGERVSHIEIHASREAAVAAAKT